MIPQISLQAKQTSTQSTIKTNMIATDYAWFVSGQFTNISAQAAQIANPATASAAIVAARGFVLPGTTFGIFPTGLIVTSIWTLFFLATFGLGTWGRMRSRNLFRKRTSSRAPRWQNTKLTTIKMYRVHTWYDCFCPSYSLTLMGQIWVDVDHVTVRQCQGDSSNEDEALTISSPPSPIFLACESFQWLREDAFPISSPQMLPYEAEHPPIHCEILQPLSTSDDSLVSLFSLW